MIFLETLFTIKSRGTVEILWSIVHLLNKTICESNFMKTSIVVFNDQGFHDTS